MPTLDDTLKAFVELGEIGGAVALVARPGTPLRQLAVGWRDVSAPQPMTTNTIFRIASLTKPVTAVAALCLADEGRFRLDDAITTVAREFEGLRVLPDPDAALDRARRNVHVTPNERSRIATTAGFLHPTSSSRA